MTLFEEERDAVQKQIVKEQNELLAKYKQREVSDTRTANETRVAGVKSTRQIQAKF